MEIDQECYTGEYVGEISNMIDRYQKNNKSFVCVLVEDKVIVYINFFAVRDALWEEIIRDGDVIRDDDIKPYEMADYQKEGNRLYILSIAITEKYRDQKQVIKLLTDNFIKYLNELNSTYKIEAIAGVAVSADGRKYLSNCRFSKVRKLKDGNVVFVCDTDSLEKLLMNDLKFTAKE